MTASVIHPRPDPASRLRRARHRLHWARRPGRGRPGLPTTVFLIGASYLFARSSPRLERRLRESRWFGSTLRRFAESGGAMPRRAKVVALLSMWAGIASSVLVLSGVVALQAATVALGLVGTATIVFRVPTLQAGIVRAHGGRASRGSSSIGALR